MNIYRMTYIFFHFFHFNKNVKKCIFVNEKKKKNVFVYGCRSEVFNLLKCNRRNNNHNNNATSNNMSGDVKREKWEILLLPTAEKRTIASVSIGRRDGHKRWDFSLIILRVKQKKNPPNQFPQWTTNSTIIAKYNLKNDLNNIVKRRAPASTYILNRRHNSFVSRQTAFKSLWI